MGNNHVPAVPGVPGVAQMERKSLFYTRTFAIRHANRSRRNIRGIRTAVMTAHGNAHTNGTHQPECKLADKMSTVRTGLLTNAKRDSLRNSPYNGSDTSRDC